MHVRVLYHDNCFDGAASAALFTEFYRLCLDKSAEFSYVGMTHGQGDVVAAAFATPPPAPADDTTPPVRRNVEHACVDFRYSADPRLDWWFDHHQSAFATPEDAAHFTRQHNPRHFYDPAAQSCSKFLAERCAEVYGFDTTPYSELIAWADLIDGAKFKSPAQAVECKEPALRLMQWVEANRDPELKLRFIRDLRRCALSEIADKEYVRSGLVPLARQNDAVLALMQKRARIEDGVVTYDVADQELSAVSKFVPYYLHPDAHYVVGVSLLPGRSKISVGSNPWHPERRRANIAAICSRYGGGGHPVVGAVSLPASELPRLREIAAEITAELRATARTEK
jgi:hypothetical protein